jgi:hypothetical protein
MLRFSLATIHLAYLHSIIGIQRSGTKDFYGSRLISSPRYRSLSSQVITRSTKLRAVCGELSPLLDFRTCRYNYGLSHGVVALLLFAPPPDAAPAPAMAHQTLVLSRRH